MTMLGMRCLSASSCSEPALCVIEQGNVTQSLYVQWIVTSSAHRHQKMRFLQRDRVF